MGSLIMLDPAEMAKIQEQFGVDDVQVRRDHLLSHLLAALSQYAAEQVIFFGGTALGRTHLPDARLSEDLDLIAIGRRSDVAARLERLLSPAVRREYGQLRWAPPLSRVRDVEPAMLIAPDGLTVRIQLLNGAGYEPWPTELRGLEQRYSNVPPARLRVPTLAAFVAWKTAAWADDDCLGISTTCGRCPSEAPWTPPREISTSSTARPAHRHRHGCSTSRRVRLTGGCSLVVRLASRSARPRPQLEWARPGGPFVDLRGRGETR